jgi:regulator of protease activity HflC (stomatin/prohibitin superfamily)
MEKTSLQYTHQEKPFVPMSGYGMFAVVIVMLGAIVFLFVFRQFVLGIVLSLVWGLLVSGFFIVNPNESRVITLFGSYVGTVKTNGFWWANPFFTKKEISLRARNLNGEKIKVNDKVGNPIEIAAVIVWQVEETARAAFEVDDYVNFVSVQSESAVRNLASSCPYDNFSETEPNEITLRGGAEKVNKLLEDELSARLERAGVKVIEARISHLAYAPEIASAMLQRQQATAVVAARRQIVDGAVGMVEMALEKLSEKNLVQLDEERKAAMVSNLLVVLCSDKSASPVVNTGTLYN